MSPTLTVFCFFLASFALLASPCAAENAVFPSLAGMPLAPTPVGSDYEHPLLSTVNYAAPANIVPGQLNIFNMSRPEGTRIFALYVPSYYGQNKTGMPLAFFFHGYSANWQQGVSLNMTDAAERMGYLIAFGQGTLSAQNLLGWRAGSCCLFNTSSVVDDVTYARMAVRAIESAVLVDARRRYAMGWSNGAMMSERLACEASDLFAGVAADEGSVVLSETSVEDSMRMCDNVFAGKRINYLHFHGTADASVPWTGSAGYPWFASTLQDVTRWATRNGCGPRVRATFNDGTFSNIVWPNCREGREVELMSVRNGVHQWWTQERGGFPTAEYAFRWFDRIHNKQVAAEAENVTVTEKPRVLMATA